MKTKTMQLVHLQIMSDSINQASKVEPRKIEIFLDENGEARG
jgi:hypothetical protein